MEEEAQRCSASFLKFWILLGAQLPFKKSIIVLPLIIVKLSTCSELGSSILCTCQSAEHLGIRLKDIGTVIVSEEVRHT